MMTLNRKLETRRKIQLGGLIKKAGLQDETTAVLYGLLLDAAEQLMRSNAEIYRTRWRVAGDLALTMEKSSSLS